MEPFTMAANKAMCFMNERNSFPFVFVNWVRFKNTGPAGLPPLGFGFGPFIAFVVAVDY